MESLPYIKFFVAQELRSRKGINEILSWQTKRQFCSQVRFPTFGVAFNLELSCIDLKHFSINRLEVSVGELNETISRQIEPVNTLASLTLQPGW